MKYLDKAPFSGRANTPEFEKNYDKIDWSDRGEDKGKDKKTVTAQPVVSSGGLRRCDHKRVSCAECSWENGPVKEGA